MDRQHHMASRTAASSSNESGANYSSITLDKDSLGRYFPLCLAFCHFNDLELVA
jgi:hypothetical protein